MMKGHHASRALVVCAITLVIAVIGFDVRGGEGATAADRLASLKWLSGSWQGPFDKGVWEAAYTSATGGVILSANKEMIDGRVVMVEFERFTVENDDVILTPYPHGRQSEATFKLVEHDPRLSRAIFVNPEHDFPSRIVYERTGADRLLITVTGREGDESKTLTLDLKRRS